MAVSEEECSSVKSGSSSSSPPSRYYLSKCVLRGSAVLQVLYANLRSPSSNGVVFGKETSIELVVIDEDGNVQTVCDQPVFGIIKDLAVLPWNEKFCACRPQLPSRQEPALDSSKYTAADVRTTEQKLRVCDICGAFLSVYDSDRRLADHFGGKLHLGYMQIREKLAELQISDVEFKQSLGGGSIEHAQPSNAPSTEQPMCPVCLERLDQDTSGILTTICNHSFHCSCISKWADSSCPVCRYCQQQAEKSICFICQTTENLWICVICGFVGCGRYKGGHAIIHWKETQHCYSLEVETKRVWDYVGDNYVHRLIQSKTDGKLVELNSHCVHADSGCGSCGDNAMREAILNSKVEAIVNEYNELLATQLENQKLYFESLLQQVEQETEGKISVAVQKAVSLKQQKIQSKIDRCNKEKKFLDELNDNLLKNEEIWKAKILQIEEREKKALKQTDDKITGLEKQLSDLMVCLEGGKPVEQLPLLNDTNGGTVSDISKESSSTCSS